MSRELHEELSPSAACSLLKALCENKRKGKCITQRVKGRPDLRADSDLREITQRDEEGDEFHWQATRT